MHESKLQYLQILAYLSMNHDKRLYLKLGKDWSTFCFQGQRKQRYEMSHLRKDMGRMKRAAFCKQNC